MKKRKSYYQILGVTPDASMSDVKRAFMMLARGSHPDAHGSDGRVEDFISYQEAYKVLSDASARARYDSAIGIRRTFGNSSLLATVPGDGPAGEDSSHEGLFQEKSEWLTAMPAILRAAIRSLTDGTAIISACGRGIRAIAFKTPERKLHNVHSLPIRPGELVRLEPALTLRFVNVLRQSELADRLRPMGIVALARLRFHKSRRRPKLLVIVGPHFVTKLTAQHRFFSQLAKTALGVDECLFFRPTSEDPFTLTLRGEMFQV